MNHRKLTYGAAVLIGIVAVAALRYARYNDIDVPWWVFVLGVPFIAILIAIDVRHRRSSTSQNASGEEAPHRSRRSA